MERRERGEGRAGVRGAEEMRRMGAGEGKAGEGKGKGEKKRGEWMTVRERRFGEGKRKEGEKKKGDRFAPWVFSHRVCMPHPTPPPHAHAPLLPSPGAKRARLAKPGRRGEAFAKRGGGFVFPSSRIQGTFATLPRQPKVGAAFRSALGLPTIARAVATTLRKVARGAAILTEGEACRGQCGKGGGRRGET